MSWEEVRLEDITSIIGDGLHGTPAYDENGEYYFINGNNLEDGKIILKNETKRISEQEYNKIKKNLSNRTIFIGINGTLGNLAIYNNEKVALGKSACYLNIKNDVNKLFVYYILKNYDFQDYAGLFATGATIKNLSLKAIRNYKFKLPSLNIQQKIVNLISNYDNLIENNNKRIKLLENMAEELYKEWFVRLRFPNYQNTKIVDGIPDGWSYIKFRNSNLKFIDGDRGKNYPNQDELQPSGYCLFLTTSNVSKNGFNFENKQFITFEKDNILGNGKLKYKDIIITTRGTIGNVVLYESKNIYDNVRINSGMLIIRDENFICNEYYLHQYFTSELFQKEVKLFSTGSAQPQLPISVLNDIRIMIPNKNILKEFFKLIKPIYESLNNLNLKKQNLKETRDLLLPRLISGKLDIKDLHIV